MYTTFKIPKRSGGFRTIEAPDEVLKAKQRAEMQTLRKHISVSPFAHAFQPYKNIVTMAMSHVGKEFVGAIDIKDFFPSITYAKFNKKSHWKTKETIDIFLHFFDFGDGKDMRLPQGAPASPFLANAYLFKFDWTMAWLARRMKCDYSRYADDIVFSGEKKGQIRELIKIATSILRDKYGLFVNHKKTRIQHKSSRQLVCGIVVNEKLNLPRKYRKNLRAEIFQNKTNLSMQTKGKIAFRNMVLKNSKTTTGSLDMVNSIVFSKELEK